MGEKEQNNQTPLAPLIGTAFHAYLEYLIDDPNYLTETRVEVGEIEGYGQISGTMDCFSIKHKQGIDWKVLGSKKIKGFMNTITHTPDGNLLFDENSQYYANLKQYYYQLQLYGRGMKNNGLEVEWLSLVMFPRDATIHTIEQDVKEIRFRYNPKIADVVLLRATKLYEWLKSGEPLDELESEKNCYTCNYRRSIIHA